MRIRHWWRTIIRRVTRCAASWTRVSINSSARRTISLCHRKADGASTDPTQASRRPALRCFGPGGNLPGDAVTHVGFFSQPAAVDFLVNGLLGQPQPLSRIDLRKHLPDRRVAPRARDAARDIGARATAPKAREAGAISTKSAGAGASSHHRDQRRPDLRARRPVSRSLSIDAPDGNRGRDGPAHRRRDEPGAAIRACIPSSIGSHQIFHQQPTRPRARHLHAAPESRGRRWAWARKGNSRH